MHSLHGQARKDFLGKPAPPGYVAGIGRGATGFTTRSDIGPAREAPGGQAARAAHQAHAAAPGDGRAGGPPARKLARHSRADEEAEEEEEEYLNEKNYDEFAGYGGSLVNKDPYEEDDEEADRIYEAIDKHLDERGKALREAKSRLELERNQLERPKIQQQFSDLKSNLRALSEADWLSIPEVGDARNRKQRVARQDKFTPIPDSLLAHQARLASGGEKLVYLDPKRVDAEAEDEELDKGKGAERQLELEAKGAGLVETSKTPISSSNGLLNIEEVSEFRSNFMKIKLNDLNNSQTGAGGASLHEKTAAEQAKARRDYLTNLQSMEDPNQITDAGTLQEYRRQFASLRASNPNFPNAWIAAVRLEEVAGKLKAARALSLEACQRCPKSADLWCEAVRLHPPDVAKGLLVRALKEIPRSEKIWLKAADMEQDENAQRRVFAKARQVIPKSLLIWKKSVELEKPAGAREILRQAVECCPDEVDLWLALARLLPYNEARSVLIRASNHNPKAASIWIMAAKLEEAAGNKSLVTSIIKRAVEQLEEQSAKGEGEGLPRSALLLEAVNAERAKFPHTCREIVRRVIEHGVSQDHLQQTLLDEARKFMNEGSPECARAVFETLVSDGQLCKVESNWLALVDFERQHGSPDTLNSVLRRAVLKENCPKSVDLWLKAAEACLKRSKAAPDNKESAATKTTTADTKSLRAAPTSEPAPVGETNVATNLDEVRHILSDALRANPDSERIILAAVKLECENKNYREAARILADACQSAKTARLVLEWAQLEWSMNRKDEAIGMLSKAVDDYKDCWELHLKLGDFYNELGQADRSKRQYSEGLKFKPTSVELWLRLAGAEERAGSLARARSKLEMARLRNPKVAQLWLESARLESRAAGKRANQSAAINLLSRGIRECRGQPDVELLITEQNLLIRRKL